MSFSLHQRPHSRRQLPNHHQALQHVSTPIHILHCSILNINKVIHNSLPPIAKQSASVELPRYIQTTGIELHQPSFLRPQRTQQTRSTTMVLMFARLQQVAHSLQWRLTQMTRHLVLHTERISLRVVCGCVQDLQPRIRHSPIRTATSTTRMAGLSKSIVYIDYH